MDDKMEKGKDCVWDKFPAEKILMGMWENIDECVAIIDESDGKILAINNAFSKLTGYSTKEITGKKIFEFIEIEYLSSQKSPGFEENGKQINTLKSKLRNPDGSKKEIEVKIIRFCQKQNSGNQVLVIFKPSDIERTLLEKKNLLFSALTEINSRFIGGASPQSVFNDLLSVLINLTESKFGFIGEVKYTPRGKPYLKVHSFTNIAWTDETRKLYAHYETAGLEFYNLNNLFGAVILSGEPVISNDPANDPRSKGVPPGHPELESFLGIPFKKGNKMIGIAGVANRAGGYTQEIVEFLEPFLISCASIVEAVRIESDRSRVEESLRTSLQLKDSLLRELHHRVKNNLQVIISLINLEASRGKDAQNNRSLTTLRNRIKAISIVHELLYQSENINKIDLRDYLLRLCENIITAFRNKTTRIKIEYHVESISLDINIAINIGIIVNELISNSIIHAFPQNAEGVIKVEAIKTSRRNDVVRQFNHELHSKNLKYEKYIIITVSDTGVGFPDSFNPETCNSLGIQLCKQLAASMEGSILISKSNQFNAVVTVVIPVTCTKK